ncbi:MAG: hypothetical protein ACK4UY_03785 [Dietzia sp.]
MATLDPTAAARWRWLRLMPPALSPLGAVLLQTALAAEALLRGTDYALHHHQPASVLGAIQATAPIWVWGAVFLFGGALLLAGIVHEQWPAAPLGHLILLTTYVSFSLGALIDSATNEMPGGWRTGTTFAALAVMHLVFLYGSWAAWRRRQRA